MCTVQNDTLHRRFVNGQDSLKQSAINSYSTNSDAARILHPGRVVKMFNHNRLYEPLKKSPLFIEFPYIRASILESAEC